jgi:hypothetical protein
MKNHRALSILAALLLLSASALASDPPSRVARLQYISGDVSLQPGGVDDWVAGSLNRPLTTADRVWTDKDARAELHLGSAVMRVNAETSLTFTNLTDETFQVELDQGTLNLRIRRLYAGEIYEVDTPNIAFTITKAGEYRFDVDPTGDITFVTVRRGQGEATGEGRSVKVKSDRQARFTGGNSLVHQVYDAPSRDGFEDWCRVRDRRQDYSPSVRYVSADVIGAEDLDDYGTWRVVPSYGAIWVPRVETSWAPYHYGHWAWVEPWGWTWIDDAPWGFAPTHYGRWVYYGARWAWVPGPVAVRPVYAPALVAWVGGSHVGVSIGFGSAPTVGWFPLGYGEPYIPPYSGSRNYFHNVNVSNTRITNITNVTNNYYNTTNVTNNNVRINNRTTTITDNSTNINVNHSNVHIRYANQEVPGAVTAVPSNVVSDSQPVAKTAVQVSRQMKETPVTMAPPVVPSRNSVLGTRNETSSHAAAPPQHSGPRQVVRKIAAPPAPVPFSAKQEALSNNSGRPLDRDTEDRLRSKISRQSSETTADSTRSNDPKSFSANAPADAPKNGAPRNDRLRNEAPKNIESAQPAPTNASRPVPRPQLRPEVARPAATDTARPGTMPTAPTTADRAPSQPSPDQSSPNTDVSRTPQRRVPRPPFSSQPQQAETRATTAPSSNSPGATSSAGATNERTDGRAERSIGQDRSVPRPAAVGNTQQPTLDPAAASPAPELRPASQPPSNNPSINRDPFRRPSRNSDAPQAVTQPSAPRVQSRPERLPSNNGASAPARAESRPQPSAPRTEAPANGGRESRPSNTQRHSQSDKPNDSSHPSTPR